jgi:hypothetical protein
MELYRRQGAGGRISGEWRVGAGLKSGATVSVVMVPLVFSC